MPLLLRSQQPTPYFSNLEDLDAYDFGADASPPTSPYQPENAERRGNRPKLMVCHDYKGGYQDVPDTLGYTFNFWSLADTFIYFAHHRVSPPPSDWVTAAHRTAQGLRCYERIFEGSGADDCLRLLIGPIAPDDFNSSRMRSTGLNIPLSAHYAELLAELAHARGFDGWLLNFECPLAGGEQEARLVAAWITLLKDAMQRRVGAHSEVVWYDSVIIDGYLRWQDRLCSRNAPFFIAADSLFTNYTWRAHYPRLSAEYFDRLPDSVQKAKYRSDIYVGVDVWGRGCHGGGGFNTYMALDHIAPSPAPVGLGLSVALFAPAWTYESKQDEKDWTWHVWWKDELKYWVLAGPLIGGRPLTMSWPSGTSGQEPCHHGPYKPIASFFAPRPLQVDGPFYTNFSPGVGKAWFVEGLQVHAFANGWTDVDKQTLICPEAWVPQDSNHLLTEFSFDDAWLGGSSLSLTVKATDSVPSHATVHLHRFRLKGGVSHLIRIVTKLSGNGSANIALTPSQSTEAPSVGLLSRDTSIARRGWVDQTVKITALAVPGTPYVEIGLSVELDSLLASPGRDSVVAQIGLLSIIPLSSTTTEPVITVMKWDRHPTGSQDTIVGRLNWQTGAGLPYIPNSDLPPGQIEVEDPIPRWTFQQSDMIWWPKFQYFNIYVLPYSSSSGEALDPTQATWIGATDYAGETSLHSIVLKIAESLPPSDKARIYVKGVREDGVVVRWAEAGSLDIAL